MKSFGKKMIAGGIATSFLLGTGFVGTALNPAAFAATTSSSSTISGHNQPQQQGGYGFGLRIDDVIAAAANILDVEESEVLAALEDGGTLAAFAEDKGTDEDDFLAELIAVLEAQIDDQVDEGTVTDDQADTLKSTLEEQLTKLIETEGLSVKGNMPEGGIGSMGQQTGQQVYNLTTLAAAILELDEDTIMASLQDGQTLAAIAEDAGVDEADFLADLVNAVTDAIGDAVDAGTLTDDQADQLLDNLSERLQQQIESEGGMMRGGEQPGINNNNNQSSETDKSSTTKGSNNNNASSTKVELKDMKGHWAEQNVNALVARGVLTGDQNSNFNPSGTVTKEQVATMLAKGFDITTTSASDQDYSDVPQNRWSYSYVETTRGYFSDENGGSFKPTEAMNRSDVVVTLIKAFLDQNDDYTLMGEDEAVDLLANTFKDADQIADEAAPYVATAVELGVIKGDSNSKFNPEKTVTRAEIATMLNTLLTIADESADE
ncbi:S-layer family protein [Paenibacillus cellulosilyticus]|uniref:S-layer family protein n=1 Tax=Paenibacillus cellulosilyticus TaxID=375489 RepID=A0A2V2YNA2_9BACL|nr:S-layer homology domain-containing protein [Paenibacillus cellulosilyticus]PWV96003.1 S-layer family protein [Paenibacillus cellulosilyticus]QKS48467.1 S-layer homology domain-containing protein [Paenibacillus cellulosilyticus]